MGLIKNSSILLVGVIISNILAYVFHFVAGRMLGPENYGEFGALMAFYLLVSLPTAALGSAVAKYTSRHFSENKLENITKLRKILIRDVIIASSILTTIVFIFSNTITRFLNIGSKIPVLLVGCSMAFTFLLPINRGVLQGLMKYGTLSINNIIESFTRLAFLIIVLYIGLGVNGAVLAYGLAYCISYYCVFPYIKEVRRNSNQNHDIVIKPIYLFIFKVLFANSLFQLLLNIPPLYVKHYYSSEFSGYWVAAFNIAKIPLFVSGAIAQVMFPIIASENKINAKRLIFGKATIMVLASSGFIAILFFLFPTTITGILYGPVYLKAASFLPMMALSMVILGLFQLLLNYILASID